MIPSEETFKKLPFTAIHHRFDGPLNSKDEYILDEALLREVIFFYAKAHGHEPTEKSAVLILIDNHPQIGSVLIKKDETRIYKADR